MTYDLPRKTASLVEQRAAELGMTPSAYLERLVELDVEGDAVEAALSETVGEPEDDWDWEGMLDRGLVKSLIDLS